MEATDRDRFEQALSKGLHSLSIALTAEQREKLWQHRQSVVEANQRFNLTRITDPADFAIKHHVDSLAVLAWIAQANIRIKQILDVGTGAGIPAIPLAIARPDWNITAIDGTAKKTRFVTGFAVALDLTNLTCRHARAEQWQSENPFDLVLFKAVGPIAKCLKQAKHHLTKCGAAVHYKTTNLPAPEIEEATQAAIELHFAPPKKHAYHLPLDKKTIARELWIYPFKEARN